jgi:serine/threonine protein phosphatase PrpC
MTSCAVSDAGRVRKSNEDSYALDDDLGLYVVADGMGGHQAGEVASRLAVEAVVGFIQRTQDADDVSWPYGIDTGLTLDGNRVRTALQLANRRVFRAAESHDDYTGMGTTVVSALLSGETFVVGHVGDSRLYIWSRGSLEQVTQDDSWAATMIAQNPGTSASDLARHPMRNVLTNVLGVREPTDIHVVERPIAPGDSLLLSSDGLHGVLSADDIAGMLARRLPVEVLVQDLVRAALDAGSRDNVTALIVQL